MSNGTFLVLTVIVPAALGALVGHLVVLAVLGLL